MSSEPRVCTRCGGTEGGARERGIAWVEDEICSACVQPTFDEKAEEYVAEIEETFIRHRGAGLILSPTDSALIHSWREQGIPLHVVLRSIEEVMTNHARKPRRRVRSIAYCQEEIEASYADWLELQVGAN